MSALVTRTPAGTPSRSATSAGPCDSPAVSQRNTRTSLARGGVHPPHRPPPRPLPALRSRLSPPSAPHLRDLGVVVALMPLSMWSAPTTTPRSACSGAGSAGGGGGHQGVAHGRLRGRRHAGELLELAQRLGQQQVQPGGDRSRRARRPPRPAGWATGRRWRRRAPYRAATGRSRPARRRRPWAPWRSPRRRRTRGPRPPSPAPASRRPSASAAGASSASDSDRRVTTVTSVAPSCGRGGQRGPGGAAAAEHADRRRGGQAAVAQHPDHARRRRCCRRTRCRPAAVPACWPRRSRSPPATPRRPA